MCTHPNSHNFCYSILLQLFLVIILNLLLCLIYKLNFIIGMYVCIGKNIVHIGLSTIHPLVFLECIPLRYGVGGITYLSNFKYKSVFWTNKKYCVQKSSDRKTKFFFFKSMIITLYNISHLKWLFAISKRLKYIILQKGPKCFSNNPCSEPGTNSRH